MPTIRRTPLFEAHKAAGAKLVDFAGWKMPVRYGSIIEEHNAVRRRMGIFDVSHMGRFLISGPDAERWLDQAIASDVTHLADHHGLYSVMCRDDGGIVDDVIVYRLEANHYLMVVNASNRQKDFDWIESLRDGADAGIEDASDETAMIALQGPEAFSLIARLAGDAASAMARFDCIDAEIAGIPCRIARTGYTGEDGVEIMPPAEMAPKLWDHLVSAVAAPCGLGARDSLRMEAALALYGNDISETTNPIEAGLGWLLNLTGREFSGREALLRIKTEGTESRFVGVQSTGREIPRAGAPLLIDGREAGKLTSGTFSPTLGIGIGLGYLERKFATHGTALEMVLRGRRASVNVVQLPFYKRV